MLVTYDVLFVLNGERVSGEVEVSVPCPHGRNPSACINQEVKKKYGFK